MSTKRASEVELDALWMAVIRSDEASAPAIRAANDPRGSEGDCERRQMAAVVAKEARRSALRAYIAGHGYCLASNIDDMALVEIALKLEIPRKRAPLRAA